MEAVLAATLLFPPYCPAASPEPTLPGLGKLSCPCPPHLTVSMGMKAAAGFESLVSLPFFGDTWFFISCPVIHPSSICPVLVAAHTPLSYLSASCSQERAGGQTSGGLCRAFSRHRWQREGSIYPHPSVGSPLAPINAPAWDSDTC